MSFKRTLVGGVILIAILYAGFIAFLLAKNHYNTGYFIQAGSNFVSETELIHHIPVRHNSFGYDGQFYYRLALSPFSSQKTLYGITLDIPALRHQRIVYPLLARLMSLGKLRIVPFALVLVNFIGIIAIALLGMYLSRLLGASPLFGLLFALYPGFLITISRDLTEILASVFVLAFLVQITRNKYSTASVFLSFALLTRETALVVALGYLAYVVIECCHEKKVSHTKLLTVIIPLGIFSIWQLTLWHLWGAFPLLADTGANLQVFPFSGLLSNLKLWRMPVLYNFIELGFLVAILGLSAIAYKRSNAQTYIKYSWIIQVVVFALWAPTLWREDMTFLRASTELYILSIAVLLGSQQKKYLVYGLVCTAWLFVVSVRFIIPL